MLAVEHAVVASEAGDSPCSSGSSPAVTVLHERHEAPDEDYATFPYHLTKTPPAHYEIPWPYGLVSVRPGRADRSAGPPSRAYADLQFRLWHRWNEENGWNN